MTRIIIREGVMSQTSELAADIRSKQDAILKDWMNYQLSALTLRRDLLKEQDLREESKRFLEFFVSALETTKDSSSSAWKPIKEMLSEISKSRAKLGFSPSETATFIFSMKKPLFALIQERNERDMKKTTNELWEMSVLIDQLGLYTTETHQKAREEIILIQQQNMLELSTPVVQLWDNILALPIIGTLDSGRTQVVMESLL